MRASKKEGAVTPSAHAEVVLPKGTFELWIEKQKPKETTSRKLDSEVTPDTFDRWMEKQKPKENVSPKLDTAAAPDTFELWMSKQVALKESADANQEAAPAEAPAQSNPA